MAEAADSLASQAFQLSKHRLEVVSKALEIQIAMQSSHTTLPSLGDFFPQTPDHAEIQQFNLSLSIPTRFQGRDEDVAMWILEKDSLDRQQVANFISDQNTPFPRNVLTRIANKICSIEAGQSFADGLKFFLPVVGIWERSFEDHADYDIGTLRYVLQCYCKAHLLHSKKPLLSHIGSDNVDDLTEVAVCVLDLFRVLSTNRKPQAQAMTDFFSSLRNSLRHSVSLNMSIKTMTDLFISASGTLVQSIRVPASIPSYLFAQVKLTGVVSLSFSFRDTMTPYHARVCHDCIYFFRLHSLCDHLHLAVPLRSLHSQRCSNSGNLDLLEILDYAGSKVPVLSFSKEVCQGSDGQSYWAYVPVSVEFHDRVLLEINPKRNRLDPHTSDATGHHPLSQHTASPAREVSIFEDEDLRYVEDWVDVLETCTWECRLAKRLQAGPSASGPTVAGGSGLAAGTTGPAEQGTTSDAAVDPKSLL